jgi:hypothetical protein
MGRLRAVTAAIACAIVASAPARVAAAPSGVVVIATAPAPVAADDTARAVAGALDEAAGTATGGPAVIDVRAAARAAWAAGAVPAARLRGFTRVAELAAEGWRAYLAVDPELAAARLATARAEAEGLLALDGGIELYADLTLRLGVVRGALGRADEAGELLRLAHALDPDRAPTASEFSPDALAAYAAAIAAAPARRAVELVVPAAAQVAIDGREVDGRVHELTVGPHVVVVRAPGRVARGRAVAIAGGAGPARIELALDEDPAAVLAEDGALAAGVDARRAGSVVAQLLLHADVDALYLLASVYRGGRPALLGQRCVDARPACTAVVEVGYADGAGLDGAARLLVDRLANARLRDGVSLPSDERLGGGRGPGPGGERRRRWIVAGVGVAVAVIVTAIVLASGDEPVPTVTIDPGDFGL